MATNEEKLNTSNSIGFGNVNNQGVINSDILNNDNGSDFNTFSEPPIPTVNVPEVPQSQLTSTEQQAQTLSEQMIEANQALLGESSFRTKQEKEQGIPELLKTQTDLQNRINELISEQKAIPLQIQQESIGMGRTVGGAAPLQTARLRENAINALSTSALLQSTQGNIATAQTLVDRAVEAKYGPARERAKIAKENLQIILDSPLYSAEQKRRAEEQKAEQERIEADITRKEADEKAILDIATETAKFGASLEVLQAIRDASSPLEATYIAQSTGLYDQEKIQQEFENSLKTGEYNLKRLQYESELRQQAFDNDISIMQLELDRDRYATDTDFKNAQLALDQMQARYTVDKIQADIDKIYSDIESKDDVSIDDMKKLYELEEAKSKKLAEETTKNIQLGKEYDGITEDIKTIDELLKNEDALTSVVGVGLGNKPLRERLTGGKLKDPEAQNFRATIHQLTSQETLNTLLALKERGGTLGAVSQTELEILKNSASKINDWEIKEKDENGNLIPTGAWNISESRFKEELIKILESQKRLKKALLEERFSQTPNFTSVEDFERYATEEQADAWDSIQKKYPDAEPDEILELINGGKAESDFNKVGSDTNKATLNKLSSYDDGNKGGQCGAFVNKLTGLGVGDSFESKMAKMDKSIKEPKPGMVFTMPYSWTGHTGIVVGVDGDDVIVKDSNWGLDEKVQTHKIKKSKISGYANV